jgi:hypothetical protein
VCVHSCCSVCSTDEVDGIVSVCSVYDNVAEVSI